MTIGIGIFLIAIGAILTFAVHATVNGIDIHTVGIILMIVGAVGVLLDLVMFMPRRRRVTHEVYTPGTATAVAPGAVAPGATVTPGTTVTRDNIDGAY